MGFVFCIVGFLCEFGHVCVVLFMCLGLFGSVFVAFVVCVLCFVSFIVFFLFVVLLGMTVSVFWYCEIDLLFLRRRKNKNP